MFPFANYPTRVIFRFALRLTCTRAGIVSFAKLLRRSSRTRARSPGFSNSPRIPFDVKWQLLTSTRLWKQAFTAADSTLAVVSERGTMLLRTCTHTPARHTQREYEWPLIGWKNARTRVCRRRDCEVMVSTGFYGLRPAPVCTRCILCATRAPWCAFTSVRLLCAGRW